MNNPLAPESNGNSRRDDLKMADSVSAGHALEIGCGRGVGVEIIFDLFSAATVDAFDLDPKMIELAGKRLKSRGDRVSLWVGDATHIEAPESTYDTVFDFGIIHHIPDWRKAVAEVHRVWCPEADFMRKKCFRISSSILFGEGCLIILKRIGLTTSSSSQASEKSDSPWWRTIRFGNPLDGMLPSRRNRL